MTPAARFLPRRPAAIPSAFLSPPFFPLSVLSVAPSDTVASDEAPRVYTGSL